MNEPQKPDASDRTDRPGKTRTWWHPLLVRLLDYELASAYTVRDEVLVGKLPLRVDILLIRREEGQLTEASRRDLSALVSIAAAAGLSGGLREGVDRKPRPEREWPELDAALLHVEPVLCQVFLCHVSAVMLSRSSSTRFTL